MTKPRRSFPRPFSCLLLAVLALAALPEQASAQLAFRSQVEVVPLTVTVTDGRGRYVTDLTGSDFTVLENGVPQALAFFASGHVPVDLALVVDVSGSMLRHLPVVQKASRGLVRALQPEDRALVAALTGSLGIVEPLSTDRDRIEAAISNLTVSGSTALYNGLYVMLQTFERERRASTDIRKQVIVLLSDGLDTASHVSHEDVVALAQRVGVNIYVITVPGTGQPRERAQRDARTLHAEHEMRALARQAGGRSFFPQIVHQLPGIYGEIARELAHQYELGYFPAASDDGAFRRLTVQVPNANARTRSGYYASRPRLAPESPVTRSSVRP
jgi:Ca-activated chloride channel homolog